MAIINLPMLAIWESLTERERYWAGYCARKLEDSGLVIDWCPESYMIVLDSSPIKFGVMEPYLFFHALLRALIHIEPVLAFRAYEGAIRHSEHVCGHGCDAGLGVAKDRIERFLKAD